MTDRSPFDPKLWMLLGEVDDAWLRSQSESAIQRAIKAELADRERRAKTALSILPGAILSWVFRPGELSPRLGARYTEEGAPE